MEKNAVIVSAAAAKKIGAIVAEKGNPSLMLRLSVLGGGCSGFQYDFSLTREAKPDDLKISRDGVTVLVDSVSLPFLEGSEIDYVEELIGASFQVRNPKAASSCGCGASFSV